MSEGKNLGMGVMIGMLGGNEETVTSIKSSLGKKIAAIQVKDDVLSLTFTDKSVLRLRDDGQSCCESRYMVCDDKLDKFVGGKLMDISLENAPDPPKKSEWEEAHEAQFLHVKTSKGSFTVSNHVEHNGYYGGFWIVASLTEVPHD